MSQKIIRVITTASDGSQKTKEFENFEEIEAIHEAIGIDDCSTVFEALTKEWTAMKPKRRKRRSAKEMAEAKALEAAQIAAGNGPKPKKKKVPRPRFPFGLVHNSSATDAPVSN